MMAPNSKYDEKANCWKLPYLECSAIHELYIKEKTGVYDSHFHVDSLTH